MQKKIIFIALFLTTITLIARDNPFEPIKTLTGKATYKKDTRENFTNIKAKLPSSARILKKVEFSFQNLDGSIETQSITIDKKVDWHNELILKKVNDVEEPIIAPINVTPKIKIKRMKNTQINFKDIVSFSIDGKELYIKTKDKKIRDFLVTNPYKIVLDFKNDISFYTKIYKLKTKNYKSITIGKHSGYYRVAIELDGKYLYNIQKVKDGYIINLR